MPEPIDGRFKATTANEPRPLSDVPFFVKRGTLYAHHANTGKVWIGSRYVSSLSADVRGIPLIAGAYYELDGQDLKDWYCSMDTANDVLTWLGQT